LGAETQAANKDIANPIVANRQNAIRVIASASDVNPIRGKPYGGYLKSQSQEIGCSTLIFKIGWKNNEEYSALGTKRIARTMPKSYHVINLVF